MNPQALSVLRDDYKLSTWLYLGAFLQAMLLIIYPSRVVAIPALLMIAYRVAKNLILRCGIVRDPSLDKVRQGKTSAQVINRDGTIPERPSDKDIVVFILGARANDVAKGRSTPGMAEITNLFGDVWREATANRDKWGFLGKTSTLIATDDENTNAVAWISYWRSFDDLHKFARCDKHLKVMKWIGKGKPNIGIMHETYVVPATNWETVYIDFVPFGLGQAKQPVDSNVVQKKDGSKVEYASGLIEAKGPTWRSMKSRMRRSEKEERPYETVVG